MDSRWTIRVRDDRPAGCGDTLLRVSTPAAPAGHYAYPLSTRSTAASAVYEGGVVQPIDRQKVADTSRPDLVGLWARCSCDDHLFRWPATSLREAIDAATKRGAPWIGAAALDTA
jgi:hypothetical protein